MLVIHIPLLPVIIVRCYVVYILKIRIGMASVKLIIMLIYCIQQKNIQRELLHFILETFVVVKKFSPFKIVIGRLANNVLDIM